MRNLATRVNPGGVLILIVVAWIGFGFGARFLTGGVPISIRNLTPVVQTVRIVDGTSGRIVSTLAIAADSSVRLDGQRVDVWYRDLSQQEIADGRTAGMIAQLLSPEGCALLAEQPLDSIDGHADIEGGQFVPSDAAYPPNEPLVGVSDPCAGQPAVPPGLVANRTTQTIVLGSRLVVSPCSKQTVFAGDLTSPAPRSLPAGAVHVRVPSIDVQDGRWPLEPRTVLVTSEDVADARGWFEDDASQPCVGHVPARFVISR